MNSVKEVTNLAHIIYSAKSNFPEEYSVPETKHIDPLGGVTIRMEMFGYLQTTSEHTMGLSGTSVHEITGLSLAGLKKQAIKGLPDFDLANSSLNRGVYFTYHLKKESCYLIRQQISWGCIVEKFVIVQNGLLRTVSKNEIMQWLIK